MTRENATPVVGPLYTRVLRLRHVRVGGLTSFLLFEGMVGLGVLLALAELVSWWAVPVLPAVVAVMVKINDMVAGGVAGSRSAIVDDHDAITMGGLPDVDEYDDSPPRGEVPGTRGLYGTPAGVATTATGRGRRWNSRTRRAARSSKVAAESSRAVAGVPLAAGTARAAEGTARAAAAGTARAAAGTARAAAGTAGAAAVTGRAALGGSSADAAARGRTDTGPAEPERRSVGVFRIVVPARASRPVTQLASESGQAPVVARGSASVRSADRHGGSAHQADGDTRAPGSGGPSTRMSGGSSAGALGGRQDTNESRYEDLGQYRDDDTVRTRASFNQGRFA